MSAPDNVTDALAQNAIGPKRVQIGNQSVEQHPLAEQIAVANHQAAQDSASRAHRGLRFSKIVPPGAG